MASLCAVVLLLGCGSGPLGLTGGSIPIGTAVLRGVVVRADNITKPVDEANVSLHLGAKHNDSASDPGGKFDLGTVAGGSYSCVVLPPENSDLGKNWNWEFQLAAGVPAQLVAALWPARFDIASVSRVGLAPGSHTLHVGESIRFVATVYGPGGAALNLYPSLLLSGSVATLRTDGTVTATGIGQATLTAWMAGKFYSANISVIP